MTRRGPGVTRLASFSWTDVPLTIPLTEADNDRLDCRSSAWRAQSKSANKHSRILIGSEPVIAEKNCNSFSDKV